MIKMQEKVILVDETDVPIGEMEKTCKHISPATFTEP